MSPEGESQGVGGVKGCFHPRRNVLIYNNIEIYKKRLDTAVLTVIIFDDYD